MVSSLLMNPVLERMSSAEQKTASPLGFSSFGTRKMGRKFIGDRFIAWMKHKPPDSILNERNGAKNSTTQSVIGIKSGPIVPDTVIQQF